MELLKVYELTEKIRYKGNSCVAVRTRDWRNDDKLVPDGYVYISVWIWAMDVNAPQENSKVEQGMLWAIKDLESITEWSFVNDIKNILVGLETHEVEENILVGDQRVFNPHERVEFKSVS